MATWMRPARRRRGWRRNRELLERREQGMRRSGLLDGSRRAPTRTPAPRTGSTLEATSIGTTKTCLISTDSPLAFILLLLFFNLQWSACHKMERNVKNPHTHLHLTSFRIIFTLTDTLQIGKTSKEAKCMSLHSNCWCLLSLQVFLLYINHLHFSLIIVLSYNDQQTSAISLPRHPLEHKNHFIPVAAAESR